MMKWLAVGLLIVGVLASSPASAQDTALQGGSWEFGGSVAYTNEEEVDSVRVNLRVGPFIADGFQLEMEPTLVWTEVDDEDLTAYAFLTNVAYNFRTGSCVVPFVLVGSGFIGISNGESQIDQLLDAGAGIKIISAEKAAVRIEYRFINQFADEFFEDEDIQTHAVLLGFSVFY